MIYLFQNAYDFQYPVWDTVKGPDFRIKKNQEELSIVSLLPDSNKMKIRHLNFSVLALKNGGAWSYTNEGSDCIIMPDFTP